MNTYWILRWPHDKTYCLVPKPSYPTDWGERDRAYRFVSRRDAFETSTRYSVAPKMVRVTQRSKHVCDGGARMKAMETILREIHTKGIASEARGPRCPFCDQPPLWHRFDCRLTAALETQ